VKAAPSPRPAASKRSPRPRVDDRGLVKDNPY
jgi:hypothetical protein